MEIAFVTTELSPFVKVGGLADVSAALPKALRTLGHAVTIVVPRFPALEAQGLLLARRLTPLKFNLGERVFEATVFDGRLASQVDLVVVDVPGLFDRPGIYGERGEDYPDNAVRFAALSRAAAELVRERAAAGRPLDVVHCNDWPTALVPAYLRALAADTRLLMSTRTVLTIHNVAHQGVFAKELLPSVGLGWDAFRVDGIEFYGGINLLKMGIATADAVTTVSPAYAREIQTPELGARLDGVLRERGEDVLMLAHHTLTRLAAGQGVATPHLTRAAQAALLTYGFPGNVRELENILERALTLCAGDEIDVADLQLRDEVDAPETQRVEHGSPLGTQLEEIERDAIVKALEQSRYNKTAAAKRLGITFRALRYRIKKLGIE